MIIHFIEYLKSFFRILNHPLNRKQKVKAAGRVLWWKANQLFFHLPAVVSLHNTKMKFICFPTSSFGSLVVYCNLPEYPEMKFFEKILKPDSVFIDVGANVGVYTLLAAEKIKKGKIYSFEPVSTVVDILYQNVRINHLEDRVTIIDKVVSDHTGQEMFVIQEISEYSHISSDQTLKVKPVPSIKLDDFFKLKKISFIDVVKIDVEGAEMKVLKGLEKYLRLGKVRNLIVELNRRNSFYGTNSNQIIDYLKKLNFKVYKLDERINLEEIKYISQDQTLNVIAILNA